MLTKRIIPCLDVHNGRVVKGINFVNLKDAGDPVEIADCYSKCNADELVFLDITASAEGRGTMREVVKRTAEKVSIPLTVGGGIGSIEDIRDILMCGADKVSLNTAAVKNPALIAEAAKKLSRQRIIVAVDARARQSGGWDVYINGGRVNTGKDVLDWVAEVEELGAGEILLTSMDRDGTKDGYDLELTRSVAERVSIPVIASGGAGKEEDFFEVLTEGKANAALAASLFHYKQLAVTGLKEYLSKRGVPVRL
ncbi:MAG: imidazole glycerol phosphate synthase subunit HisF [Bacillota bacterium]|nr:imidazole glycerol phosphate synthase subunit HisF [Bacillota bacterium]MDD3299106.1 imidazole glycerol phosphate synthase subunit HisF [Bacillota bacterium]MDD3851130.1 imidazole glycerol phosphate synthase subunit HisF [Bacillota bacterium]MDD4706945.1 imidazole glycerol phosphate synthase subunit HisF [Bacillota bacterium]